MTAEEKFPGELHGYLDSYFDKLFVILQEIQKDINNAKDEHIRERLQARFNDVKNLCNSINREKTEILTRPRLKLIECFKNKER